MKMMTVLVGLCVVAPVVADDNVVVGSGIEASQSREVVGVRAIEIHIAGNVHVEIGEPTSLEIVADDNILPLIKTEVKKGSLVISATGQFRTKHQPVIKITVANLEAVAVFGSGDVDIKGLDNESLSVAIDGSGDVRPAGQTVSLTVSISGSGDVLARQLEARDASVTINGSGDAKVSVAKSLNVVIQGSGDVKYTGAPEVRSVINGSGSVSGDDK